jgi:hypothetical protein
MIEVIFRCKVGQEFFDQCKVVSFEGQEFWHYGMSFLYAASYTIWLN